jgi:type I restriction enzyme S subunit
MQFGEMNNNLPELPKGWVWTKISDVCELINGRAFKPSEWASDGLPIIRIQNLNDCGADFNFCNFDVDKKYIVENGELLFAWSGTPGTSFGAHIWKRGKAVLNQHIFRVIINEEYLNKSFLMHLFNQNVDEYIRKAHGTAGLAHITKSKFENSLIPLPPLPEQHRIVAKIEELFTRLDAGVEALKKIKSQLKRYRQAVLKYAFEGKLTQEWREAHKGELEHASVLLERIKEQRKQKTKTGGANLRVRSNDGQTHRSAPTIDPSELPELPDGWVWTRLGEILNFEYGKGLRKDKRNENGKIPVYGSNGIIGYHEISLTDKPCIIIGRKGAVGEIHLSKVPCWPIDTTYYIYPPSEVNLEFLYYLLSNLKLSSLDKSTAIPGINRNDVYNLTIPIPPLPEQHQIGSEIETRFSVADQIEKIVEQSLKQSERLRQSILKRAFEGKLVPQDPTDEPADKLLERIKEERIKQEKERKLKKDRRKKGG